jgi:Coenzyme PQQ synthesis protein D (PqqD)
MFGEEMDNKNYPQVRNTGLVVQEMPDEVLIYDLNTNKAHCLNDSAATVWRACDGTNSIADIAKQFQLMSGSKVTDDFVWLAIDQLNDNGLMEPGTASRISGQSRRDVLKKIGLASMVALPIIASLAAPQNALASGSCTCANAGDCAGVRPGCAVGACGGSGQCVTGPIAPKSATSSKT